MRFCKLVWFPVFVFASLFSCEKSSNPNETSNILLSRFLFHKERVRVLGSVYAPGAVKNANIYITTLPSVGTCASGNTISPNSKILTSGTTGVYGDFNLSYLSEGTAICMIATPGSGSNMSVFNTFSSTTTTITWSGSYSITAVFSEPQFFNSSSRGVDGVYKFAYLSPFTSVVERRFWGLKASSPNSANSILIAQANNDATKTILRGLSGRVEENDPTSEKYSLRLNGYTFLADKITNVADGNISSADLNSLTDYMREDFSDGIFDEKKINAEGVSVSITRPAVVTSASTFVTSTLKTAVDSYITAASLPEPLKLDQSYCDNSYTCTAFLEMNKLRESLYCIHTEISLKQTKGVSSLINNPFSISL